MLRVIRLTQPEWVIAENVRGLATWNDGMVLEQVCTDLEAEGYEVQPLIIPAVAVNAPHRRDRIWFVAHTKRGADGGTPGQYGSKAEEERHEVGQPGEPDTIRDVTDPASIGREPGGIENRPQNQKVGSQGQRKNRRPGIPDWGRDWTEVAAELCSLDDGLPVALDGFELSKSQHRKEQLKAYGNAIVPQVAMEIMRAMKETTP
jgi:DNA (cytosine-5)-methyltransferase 1